MSTLRCSASNQNVQFNLPAGVDITGAYTVAILVMPRTAGAWQALVAHTTSGGVVNLGMERDSGNRLEADVNNGAGTAVSTATVTTTAKWWLLVVTKASGSVAPRAHLKNVTDAGAWTHQAMTGTVGNPPSASGGKIIVGEWSGSDDLNANVAVIGGWAAALSDLDVEALATGLHTAAWTTHSTLPKYVHELTATSGIADLMGNGATFASCSATLDTGSDPTGWVFDGAGGGAPAVSSTMAVTAHASVAMAGRKGALGAVNTVARASTAVVGRRSVSSAVTVIARAVAVLTGQRTAAGALSATVRASVAFTGKHTATSTLMATSRSTAVLAGQKGALGAVAVTVRPSVAVPGQKGAQGALSVTARAAVVFSGSTAAPAVSSTINVTAHTSIAAAGRKGTSGTFIAEAHGGVVFAGRRAVLGTMSVAGRASVAMSGSTVFAKSSTMTATARVAFIATAGLKGIRATFTPSARTNLTAAARKGAAGQMVLASRVFALMTGRQVATGTFTARARVTVTIVGMVGSPPDSTYGGIPGGSYGVGAVTGYADAVGADPRVSTYGG